MKRHVIGIFAVFGAASAMGCTTILGIDNPYVEAHSGGNGGMSGTGGSAGNGGVAGSGGMLGGAGSGGGLGGSGGSAGVCTDGAMESCYAGDPSTQGVGVCIAGARTCAEGMWGACIGEVVPVTETCNVTDDDCDGQVDNLPSVTCGQGICQVTVAGCIDGIVPDCIPGTPSSVETCDGMDDDCDGETDEGCPCMFGQTQPCYTGSPATKDVGQCVGGTQPCEGMQWGVCTGEILPQTEACDGKDNDCNGQTDEGLGMISCGVGECVMTATACVSGQPGICVPKSPMTEVCDGKDNNCNGKTDEGNPEGGGACNTNKFGICMAGTFQCLVGNLVCVQNQPPSPEMCDGLDNNCDGQTDEGVKTTFYKDTDGDEFGNPNQTVQACTLPAGYVANNQDCNDSNFAIKPSATEVCDGVDNNCNGTVDEGVKTTYYKDTDGDGYGNPSQTTQACSLPAGYATNNQDCNDSNVAIKPSATEVCNGVDDDCDSSVDENNPGGGAACTTSGLGLCAPGTMACASGALTCVQNVQPSLELCTTATDESCDGLGACTGSFYWSKGYGGSNNDQGNGIAADASGNVLVTGSFYNSVNFGGGALTSAGVYDVFLLKLNSQGSHVWSKRFGNTSTDYGTGIATDSASNVFVAGTNYGTIDLGGGVRGTANTQHMFVAKLNSTGQHIWSKVFAISNSSSFNTITVRTDGAGNVVMAGDLYNGPVDFGGGPLTNSGSGGFVVKLDPNGNHLWSKAFTGAFVSGFAVNSAGDVAIAGSFKNTINLGGGTLSSVDASYSDIFVAKFAPSGLHAWSKKFGQTYDDYATGVVIDTAGNVVFSGDIRNDVDFGGGLSTGDYYYDAAFVKLGGLSGNHIWNKRFTTPNQSSLDVRTGNLAIDSGGNIVGAAYPPDWQNNVGVDFGGGSILGPFALLKLDANGDHIWSKGFTSRNISLLSMTTDSLGSPLLTGYFQYSAVDFGGGPLQLQGGNDIFVAKFAP